MALIEIKFLPWTGKAVLSVEVGDEIDPAFRLKAALEIEVGKARKEGRGADLSGANLSEANLRGANLSEANLSGANLSGANLRGANLREADLREANLSGANLRGANLSGANLREANLSGANLRGANLSGVPKIENIDAAILGAIEEAQKVGGGLEMGSWHTCETTHCRAGWAVTLAGDAGKALEFALGTAAAGALIYAASSPYKPIPDFYATNAEAMRDMRQRAGFEAETA